MTFLRLTALLVFLGMALPACAQNLQDIQAILAAAQDTGDTNVSDNVEDAKPESVKPSGGSFVVTPVEKCFDALGAHESMKIRRDFENPYQECQRRLNEKEISEKQKQDEKDTKDDKKESGDKNKE